jgi:DNA adenine methylase
MSAFGYFGSKLRIAAKMHDKLPPHNAWVELFCGSAAMTLAKDVAPLEVINDINSEIVNFYKQLRLKGDELLRQIELTPYSREELQLAREGRGRISNLERARRFFISAMMAVNGSFGPTKGGFSISNSYSRNGMEARVARWYDMPRYLAVEVVERLRHVRVENKDALTLFKDFANRPATLAYLDPPYLGERTRGYDHDEDSEKYHEDLLKAAIKAKCMVFISGYASDLYTDYLTKRNGWSKLVIDATTKGNNGKSFKREEIIWFNSAFTEALKSGVAPIKLRKKETRNRKINPVR